MSATTEVIWFRTLLPAYESTGGIAQTNFCLVCGAAVVVTQQNIVPATLHIEYHTKRGESP